MRESRAIDPARVRAGVLEALHHLPLRSELDGRHALRHGDFEIEDDPVDHGQLRVRVGELTVLVDRDDCMVADVAALVGWLSCSASVGQVPSWNPGVEPTPVPQGEIHAYRLGEHTTACGLSLEKLHLWDDRPFTDGLLNRCSACLDRIASD